jgi:hypothetical protein
MRKTLKPPLLGYYTMSGGGAAPVATPWYLAGDIDAADCVAAYLAKGAADYAASKSNLTGDTDYDLTESDGAVTWDADTGWAFNYGTEVLLTGYKPVHPVSIIVRASNMDDSAAPFDLESYSGGSYTVLAARGDAGFLEVVYGDVSIVKTPGASSGVICITPQAGYLDGVAFDAIGAESLDNKNLVLPVGGWHVDGYFEGRVLKIQALAIYAKTLSEAEVEALTTAMYAL